MKHVLGGCECWASALRRISTQGKKWSHSFQSLNLREKIGVTPPESFRKWLYSMFFMRHQFPPWRGACASRRAPASALPEPQWWDKGLPSSQTQDKIRTWEMSYDINGVSSLSPTPSPGVFLTSTWELWKQFRRRLEFKLSWKANSGPFIAFGLFSAPQSYFSLISQDS